MHSHHGSTSVAEIAGGKKIVLIGNPNVGKSVVFNYLSGLYAEVSNFPGTTVDIHRGRMGQAAVIDTPGVYGISSFSEDESVVRSMALEADVVVNVVDASHLERDLFLTLQLVDMGFPLVVALNMTDEAHSQGLVTDIDHLSTLLGVPVIPTVATQKKGLETLRQRLDDAQTAPCDAALKEWIAKVGCDHLSRAEAVLLLEGDQATAQAHGIEPLDHRDEVYGWRRERVSQIAAQVVRHTRTGISWRSRLGYWMMQPITGIPILMAAMFVMYKVLGELIAGDVVGFTEGTLGQGIWEPWIRGIVEKVFPHGSVVASALVGEFGMLTMTITYLFGVILPLVIGFYLLLAMLEDSGYLPRIAVMVDGLLQRMGLNGRAIIPIILGFGCVTMATISTRILDSRRERMIATYLMALAIPCSAQLGVVLGILAAIGGGWYALAYVATISAVFVITGTLLARFVPGQSSDLLLDIPPIRIPRLENVLRKTSAKVVMFMKDVTLFFALGALLLTALRLTGALEGIQGLLAPLTEDWLRLPRETATAFVMGFVRRDFGAAGLYKGSDLNILLTPMQSLVALVAITLFVPCIASVLIILKERGGRYLTAAWVGALATAFLVAGIMAQAIEVLNR